MLITDYQTFIYTQLSEGPKKEFILYWDPDFDWDLTQWLLSFDALFAILFQWWPSLGRPSNYETNGLTYLILKYIWYTEEVKTMPVILPSH